MSKRKISRRKFLGEASCAAVGTTTLFSSIMNLGMASALSRPMVRPGSGNYKAMVCILLSGGNDSYNMLIPNGAEYSSYSTVRTNLAIPQDEVLGLSPLTPGMSLGLHPAMPRMQQKFQEGKLACIANVGTLVEPTTKQQILNSAVQIPVGLFSHSDQQMQWQTSIPQERTTKGWAGKMADMLQSMNTNQDVSMNISLSGNNIYQSGNTAIPYAINPDNGSIGILGYDAPDVFHQLMTSGVNSLLNQEYQDVFKQSYANVIKNSVDSNARFNAAVGEESPFTTVFSDNYVSNSMQMIARTIAAQEELGMQRQTFFLSVGGWDNHDELLNNQAELLTILDNALGEFYSALDEVNMNDCVTTFTISDFARTMTSNGNGTDHAWGGHCMILGDAVNGQEIYGTYPELALGSNDEVGGGVYIPTTSVDEYFAELALWFGVSPFDLPVLLPNIGNFYSVGSGANPIGFMQL